jgi:hypothetical protein
MSTEIAKQRTRGACISCRQRKRKCDGQNPCTYCFRNEHHCKYDDDRKKAKSRDHRKRWSRGSQDENIDETFQLRLLEANSAAVFVRRLGLKINPALAPSLSCYAWNLGLNREVACLPESLSITNILTSLEMRELAEHYFTHVGPAYSFLASDYLDGVITNRWANESLSDPADSLLCGVAALGCLFDHRSSALENQLVESARNALEHSSFLPSPEINHVLGWLLRVIYLRATGSPHANWMASCTLIHMIETTKLHLEPSDESILSKSGEEFPAELRRSIYWIARLFNAWVSSDCGKSQVELRGASSELPRQSWTKEQEELCFVSCSFLDPKFNLEPSEMEAELARIYALEPVHPMLLLLQCNLALCFFRRSRAMGRFMSDSSLNLIFGMLKSSLGIVNELVSTFSPWWHVVNIPFQGVMVLLVINSDQALRLLPEALRTLHRIVNEYKTDMCQESYEIACFLVAQERQRRIRKLDYLSSALEGHEISRTLGHSVGPSVFSESSQSLPIFPQQDLEIGLDPDTSLLDYFLFDNFTFPTSTSRI